MTRPAPFLLFALTVSLLLSAGCGSSRSFVTGTGTGATVGTRTLQSLTVIPSSADAQKFPANQVQFTVTGTFTVSPVTVMSPAVRWSIGNPFATPTPAISIALSSQPSIDANGLAQCNGFVGIATVVATAPVDPTGSLIQMTAITPHVSGTASLICP